MIKTIQKSDYFVVQQKRDDSETKNRYFIRRIENWAFRSHFLQFYGEFVLSIDVYKIKFTMQIQSQRTESKSCYKRYVSRGWWPFYNDAAMTMIICLLFVAVLT